MSDNDAWDADDYEPPAAGQSKAKANVGTDGERGGGKLHGAWGSLEGPRRALAGGRSLALYLFAAFALPLLLRARSL